MMWEQPRRIVALALLLCRTCAPLLWPATAQPARHSEWPASDNTTWTSDRGHIADSNWGRSSEEGDEASAAARRLAYTGMEWDPSPVVNPPGGGAPALFAGVNYTRWSLLANEPVATGGRVLVVVPNLDQSAAWAGVCQLYTYIDLLPPLDGSRDVPAVSLTSSEGSAEWTSPPQEPMRFTQGGTFKLCWSPDGSFGIAKGEIVPFATSVHRVYGVFDPCNAGPGCLAARRFFCYLPNRLYAHYLPTGTQCYVFISFAYSPLLFSRLTWATGSSCGVSGSVPGAGLQQYNAQWARTVDPLSLIDLGLTSHSLDAGFSYLLCFCAAYDSSTDGVCSQTLDFVQQVGVLRGIMASFEDVQSVARTQVVPMTRFAIRIDCGAGPYCDTDDFSRVKLVEGSMDPTQSKAADKYAWDANQSCATQLEVEAWYSPSNCENGTVKLSAHCQMSGGTDASFKLFGYRESRILPKYESGAPVAQFFQVCFVHRPLDVDGIDQATWNPASPAALQANTRIFWKVGELVVEPLLLNDPEQYVMMKPITLRVSPPDRSQTTILHDGSLLKLVEERRNLNEVVDSTRCAQMVMSLSDVEGLVCLNSSSCTPQATLSNNELVIPNVRVRKAGIFALCYCEGWAGEANSCERWDHWVLVGKVGVSGPLGSEEWNVDAGMVLSIEISGYSFTEDSVVKILQPGQLCDDPNATVESTVCLFTKGRCIYHGETTNQTHIADLATSLRRHNTTSPASYIASITSMGDGTSLLNFVEVPVLEVGDILFMEDNVAPMAAHWVRQRDLGRIMRGGSDGLQVTELLNDGLSARVPLSFHPTPPHTITPPGQGRWYRNSRIKLSNLRSTESKKQMPVCWGPSTGDYVAFAGYLNVQNPAFMARTVMGLTATGVGSRAPAILIFWTTENPLFREPRNPTQLRLTFTNSTILAPAQAGAEAAELGPIADADQLHEASQAVCGRLLVELKSDDEFGFPVPKGCYFDADRYDSSGEIRSIYILFDAFNGLRALRQYTIVLNVHLVSAISDYASLPEPLVEIAALDDIIIKPEGIIEIGWANPDKPIQEGATATDSNFMSGVGGPSIVRLIDQWGGELTEQPPVLNLPSDQLGFKFLLRGDTVGKIQPSSILRFFLFPLTAWDLNSRDTCNAACTAQEDYLCGPWVGCTYEATVSECLDVIPPGRTVWLDSRGRECAYYALDRGCELDGEAYTPDSGITAWNACCICGGGERQNANIVRLRLPDRMDAAYGSTVIHTIRVSKVTPVPTVGFFPTRWGVQLSSLFDRSPTYALNTGSYLAKAPAVGSYATVATLVGLSGWGNSRPFYGDPELNDFYLRITMPLTTFGTAGYGSPSGAAIVITMPPGYECKAVYPASPIGEGDDTVPLQVLPENPPTGNGALPGSDTGQGNLLGLDPTIPSVGIPSGQWMFVLNQCRFDLAPYYALSIRQRVYLYILARNPNNPLPYTDPANAWYVSFTSRGDATAPAGYSTANPPCGGTTPIPAGCGDTGENFYVNPKGVPETLRSFQPLYPNASNLLMTAGPFRVLDDDGSDSNETFVDKFSVMGKLAEALVQPSHFNAGSATVMSVWFIPDLGTRRGGQMSITCPDGFVFPDPCVAQDLPASYYALYAPPGDSSVRTQRLWPIEGMGACHRHLGPNSAVFSVEAALVSGRHYGFEIGATNPTVWDPATGSTWTFKLFTRDAEGRPRDGTYTTAAFQPGQLNPWELYSVDVSVPVAVDIVEMRPYVWTNFLTMVDVFPIQFPVDVRGQLRIIAPEGYEWSWDPFLPQLTFVFSGLIGQTRDLPGGIPPVPDPGRLNVITWPNDDLYEGTQAYGFRTLIKVPAVPPRSSSNAFFFEWGYNASQVNALTGRAAATRALVPPIKALRGFHIEMSSTVAGDTSALWIWIETITTIPGNGSLEFELPFNDMPFQDETFWDREGRYCTVQSVEDFGSDPLPSDVTCRRVEYPNALMGTLVQHLAVRIELLSPTAIPAGKYILEFNVTNPTVAEANAVVSNTTCGHTYCYQMYSTVSRPEIIWVAGTRWETQATPVDSDWQTMNDYWTAIPSLRITTRLAVAEIANLTLDERLACGRHDRPSQRSALVFALMLDSYTPQAGDMLEIRAPIGYRFDSLCDFYTNDTTVYPPALGVTGRPETYTTAAGTTYVVLPWPESATPESCHGDGHLAYIKLGSGLVPQSLYMFRISLQMNPPLTPLRNTWEISYGAESSGKIPGFHIWTFPQSYIDSVSMESTPKETTPVTPVTIVFRPTNSLQAFVPPLAPDTVLNPLLRVIMPPQFELVIAEEDQDINGGTCIAVIQEKGDCRTCESAWEADSVSCFREWNRKNVARVRLLNSSIMESFHWYKLSLAVYNPHTIDSFETPTRHWTLETFLGEPWPAQPPVGYELDKMNVTGFKISFEADFQVEVPEDRNGSALVSPMLFSVKFSELMDPVSPDDVIVLRAPAGYDTTEIIPGLYDRVVCAGFEWMPAEYRKINGSTVLPPPRPPVPPPVPMWAEHTRIWSAASANISNITDTIWEHYDFTVLGRYCSQNVSVGDSFLWQREIHSGVRLNMVIDDSNVSASGEVALCVSAVVGGAAVCTDVPATRLPPSGMVLSVKRLSPDFSWVDGLVPPMGYELGGEWPPPGYQDPGDGTVDLAPGTGPRRLNTSNASADGNASTSSTAGPTTSTTTGLPLPICAGVWIEVLWGASQNLQQKLDDWNVAREAALKLASWDKFPLQAEPVCGDPTADSVTWYVNSSNIHPEGVEFLNGTTIRFRLAYRNPLRPPLWHENFWTIRHSSPSPFEPGGGLRVSSSASYASWSIVSKLRFVYMELLTEILRPGDPAEIHIEFVTVNLADKLYITATSPEGFDFTNAFISSPVTGGSPSAGRRLLLGDIMSEDEVSGATGNTMRRKLQYRWQGFTQGIAITEKAGPNILLGVDFSRQEYVRMRLDGVIIPWVGGQALFTLVTEMRSSPSDEIRNCCPPGYPPDDPGIVFRVPYRMDPISANIYNNFQQEPLLYLLESMWENRYGEVAKLVVEFQVQTPHRPSDGDSGLIILVVRAPPGYTILGDATVADTSKCVVEEVTGDGDVCGLEPRASSVVRLTDSRIDIALPGLKVMTVGTNYEVTFRLLTPTSMLDRVDSSLPASMWVLELNDAAGLAQNPRRNSTTLGSFADFMLLNHVNFSMSAGRTPPDTVIEVTVEFKYLGELRPTQVEVYAPDGFKWLPSCLVEPVWDAVVSCRERWSLFGATYLTGAILMMVDGGVPFDQFPVVIKLLVRTPVLTPDSNKWFVRTRRVGITNPISWGGISEPFHVIGMDVGIAYAAVANTRVTLYLRLAVRYGLPWNGHVLLQAPRTYQTFCPVAKVLTGPAQEPLCTQDDDLLDGCVGLPAPGDVIDDTNSHLPLCDPLHEMLMTFPWAVDETLNESVAAQQARLGVYAIEPGESMLLAIDVLVPSLTPLPRSENVFRVRLLDANRVMMDGRMNLYGTNVRSNPIVRDFKLWWSLSVPNVVATVALEFYFNISQSASASMVKVIDVVAPENVVMAIRRPPDVKRLTDEFTGVPVSNWSWSTALPRHLWFSLNSDPGNANFSGLFHFAFPILTPPAFLGFPLNNIWEVQFCGDSLFCTDVVLRVPVAGFTFGQSPDFELSPEALARITGSHGRRRTAPSQLLLLLLFLLLAGPPSAVTHTVIHGDQLLRPWLRQR